MRNSPLSLFLLNRLGEPEIHPPLSRLIETGGHTPGHALLIRALILPFAVRRYCHRRFRGGIKAFSIRAMGVSLRGVPCLGLAGALALCLLTSLGAACISGEPTLEERAYALDRQLMCPVCDGQTIDQSNAQVALDMKGVLREKLAGGESEAQIRAYFRSRYGEAVLASPRASGFTAVVWAAPPVALVLGIVVLAMAMRRIKSRRPGGQAIEEELEEYLAEVDRDLGLDPEKGAPEDAQGGLR